MTKGYQHFPPALNFAVGTLASTSTALLACTDELPGDELRLIVDGSVVCYTTWQWLLVGLLVVIVAAFVVPIGYAGLDAVGPRARLLVPQAAARSPALQSVAKLAKAPFKEESWYWLGVLALQRVALGVVQALATLTPTVSLGMCWGVGTNV